MDLFVEFRVNYELSFPPGDNSLNPLKLAVEVNFKSFNQCQVELISISKIDFW